MPFEKGQSGNPSTQFQKGVSGNPKGRPRKLTSTILDSLKSEGFEAPTASHVREACMFLVGMDKPSLRELEKDEDTPVLFRIIARALLSPRSFQVLEKILDRTCGKVLQIEKTQEPFVIQFVDAWNEDTPPPYTSEDQIPDD